MDCRDRARALGAELQHCRRQAQEMGDKQTYEALTPAVRAFTALPEGPTGQWASELVVAQVRAEERSQIRAEEKRRRANVARLGFGLGGFVAGGGLTLVSTLIF
jgi:hypothetical protein